MLRYRFTNKERNKKRNDCFSVGSVGEERRKKVRGPILRWKRKTERSSNGVNTYRVVSTLEENEITSGRLSSVVTVLFKRKILFYFCKFRFSVSEFGT